MFGMLSIVEIVSKMTLITEAAEKICKLDRMDYTNIQ